MTRSQLVALIGDRNPHLYQRDVERVVDIIIEGIAAALAQGNRVELRDFGVFWVKRRDARSAHNPRTGGSIAVTARRFIAYRAGKNLVVRLNASPPPKSVAARRV